MPSVTYTQPNGTQQTLQVESGTTLMRAAVNNGIDGIIGECGGQAMCATCHVYVRPEYAQALPDISDDEDEMLDCATAERTDSSLARLPDPTQRGSSRRLSWTSRSANSRTGTVI
ncbi:2Fe-2S iron-sulfur cluster-binding protein [Arthrobacter sp. alpha11c]